MGAFLASRGLLASVLLLAGELYAARPDEVAPQQNTLAPRPNLATGLPL